ncbi:MAG: putative Serine phosphatase RsbU, regulator of sigma subunit [Blastococcus sp.]|nr:putative Serine phosphatase RsbU, regulator of sigma subunit [Blastococcus sp.]
MREKLHGLARDAQVAAVLNGRTVSTIGLLADYQRAQPPLPRPGRDAVVGGAVSILLSVVRPDSGPTAVGPLLEHAPIAVLLTDATGALLGWNRRAEVLLGLGTGNHGSRIDQVLPVASSLIAAAGSPGADGAALSAPPPSLVAQVAGRIDVELSAVRTQTGQGRPVVLFLAVDVTARREAEHSRDRLAEQVQLLGEISESLMLSLDPSEALSRLAAALVPALADWVSVQVREEDERVYDVVVRHRDPALRGVGRRIEHLKTHRGLLTDPSRRAAGGENVLLPHVTADQMPAQVPDPELRALVQQLGMGSALAVPIPGKVGLHGSMLLVNTPGGAGFTQTDLALAVEIGRRTGIALDNARLYASQRHLATELQQSLLTDPPTVPFADVAVRYVAAARRAEVGGDWYDAFRRRTGELMLVIGDVAGHDTRAAAAMGQLRGLLRGIGFTTADDPSQVLSGVDEAIEGLELATLATAVVAELSPPEDGVDGVRLRWSNAGHPVPLLLDASGKARLLTSSRGKADLLLGIDPATPRITETATLPFGSTLLLVTDGLIERRGEFLDDGVARLLRLVEEQSADDLDRFCDAIVDGMVPKAAADDVAIVVVRPHPVAREDGQGRTARVGTRSDQPGRSRAGHADQELWGRRPPPARTPEFSVLGRWEPRTPADLTASRLQLAEAASAVARPAAEAAERLELVFEELVSNGLRHGRGRVRVTVTATGTGWLLEVIDAAGNTPPAPAIDRDAALGGLGLFLVARLSSAHGWAPADAGGKVVWAHVEGSHPPAVTEEAAARRSQ